MLEKYHHQIDLQCDIQTKAIELPLQEYARSIADVPKEIEGLNLVIGLPCKQLLQQVLPEVREEDFSYSHHSAAYFRKHLIKVRNSLIRQRVRKYGITELQTKVVLTAQQESKHYE